MIFRRKKERKFFGHHAEQMDKIIETLCDLCDGIDMTDDEAEAMDIAIHSVVEIQYAMLGNGKVLFDD